MSDLISRDEAVKVLEDMKVKIEIPKAAVTQWKRNNALDMAVEALKHSEVQNSSDCISRQAAIYIASGYCHPANIADELSKLPSAEPKKGKWIKADSQQYFRKHYPAFTCSECGHRKDSQKTWNYCPNCGAKMEVEHE